MLDPQAATALLKSCLPTAVKCEVHGKDQIVIGHHRFHRIGQLRQHLLQEIRGDPAGAIRSNLSHAFPTVVVDRREFILRTWVIEVGQIFQIQMKQLSRPRLFIAMDRPGNDRSQPLASVSSQNSIHRGRTHPGFQRDACWPPVRDAESEGCSAPSPHRSVATTAAVAASEGQALRSQLADTASTIRTEAAEELPFRGSARSKNDPVYATSSATLVLPSRTPLLAPAASWRLILRGVTNVLKYHREHYTSNRTLRHQPRQSKADEFLSTQFLRKKAQNSYY
jgi:hypothetical protein